MPLSNILAAFDQGQVPTISLVNLAVKPLPFKLQDLCDAMQVYLDKYFVPVWGTPARLTVEEKKITDGNWGMVFYDHSDVLNALGYHDLTPAGFPLSKVFTESDEPISVTASHELVEMLVDPGIQMVAQGPRGWYAYEVADAVEALSFDVSGFQLTDFVYPSWFEGFRKANSTKFDHMGKCIKPFQILRGGYMPLFTRGRWTQIYGSKEKELKFKREKHPRAHARKNKK